MISGQYTVHVENDGIDKEFSYEVVAFSPPIFENTTLNGTTVKVISDTTYLTDLQVNGLPIPEVCFHLFCNRISSFHVCFKLTDRVDT